MSPLVLWGVPLEGEIRPGADLGALIAAALLTQALPAATDAANPADGAPADAANPAGGAPADGDFAAFADGDIVIVTSKVVSKAEGRLVPGTDRNAAIASETVRVVATRGDTRIVQTRHGLVLAAAGVDASNVPAGQLALLPQDPDASARAIRDRLRDLTGRTVAVIVTDTAGRPWRNGLVDIAIGVAGIAPLRDERGKTDAYGHPLVATELADADAIAAAAELVKGKLAGVPVAVLRGLSYASSDAGARALVRGEADDLFRWGSREVVPARRSVREFTTDPVDLDVVRRAIAVAATAPAPHHTTPWRFVLVTERRARLLHAMREQWRADLTADGFATAEIEQRLARGDILSRAPLLVVPAVVTRGAHDYPDARRRQAEREMFVASAGAAIENFLIALTAEGLASCWISSTMFCREVVREVLELDLDIDPMGAIAVGHAYAPPPERPSPDLSAILLER